MHNTRRRTWPICKTGIITGLIIQLISNEGFTAMKTIRMQLIAHVIQVMNRIIARCRHLVASGEFLLACRVRAEAFGIKRRISPFAEGKIQEVVKLLIKHPHFYSDLRYSRIGTIAQRHRKRDLGRRM